MIFKKSLLIFSGIAIIALLLVVSCIAPVTTETSISIAGGAAITNDSTPSLTISAVGATYMAFSGNGTTWGDWATYATSYSSFNITTGAGCSTGDGAKTVYAKFKNAAGTTFDECNDSIIYDITRPKLLTAVCSDDKGKGSGTINTGDIITFTFDEDIKTSTITSSNFTAQLPLSSSSAKYGTGATFSWSTSDKVCRITLGTLPNIPSGTTVNPSSTVTDAAGNADNSTAVTISFTASALTSVTISPASKTYTEGDTTTTTFTAVAKNTAGTDITSLCTFAWTESGLGSISPATGSSTVYTPVASGTGTNTITVNATYLTVTKLDTSTVTINAAISSTDPDATKLSINGSAGTGNFEATYTDVPTGATVKVYCYASNSPTDAVAAGAISEIGISNHPTACSNIADDHYIFFKIFYSDTSTSATTADGQMPSKPDGTALAAIQATNKNTITSTAAGTVDIGDKITLYVGTTKYSYPTTVGSTMTSTIDLVADDLPLYTRTNANGHESLPSTADGKILSPTVAAANGGSAAHELEAGDTITLTFDPAVTVTADILLPHISWVTTNGSSKFGGDNTTPLLDGPVASATTVVLTAFAGCVDIDSDEVVTFNIAANIPIVDTTGNNQVLPLATAVEFDSGDF